MARRVGTCLAEWKRTDALFLTSEEHEAAPNELDKKYAERQQELQTFQ